jgi:hypothetical protein
MTRLSRIVMAGLLALPACSESPERAAAVTNADQLARELEAQADNMEALADDAADANTAALIEQASENLEAAADNVRDAADEASDKR